MMIAISAFLVMGLDVAVSTLKFFDSNNYIRFATGFLAGWFFALVLLQLKNILMWKKLIRRPYLNNKVSFPIWIVCGIGLAAAFIFSYREIMVFWGVVSIAGMIIFITLILLILFFGVCRRLTNSVDSWKYYILIFAAGIVFGTGVLALLSIAREFLI